MLSIARALMTGPRVPSGTPGWGLIGPVAPVDWEPCLARAFMDDAIARF
jgi:hypothetical protein